MSRIDLFLNKLSYAGKLRFLIVLGTFIITVVMAIMYMLQRNTINLVQTKLVGLENFRELEELLHQAAALEIKRIGNHQDYLEKISEFEEALKNFTSHSQLDLVNERMQNHNFLSNQLAQRWENMKNEVESGTLSFIPITDSLLGLIDENTRIFELILNAELSSYILTDLGIIKLPHIQTYIPKIIHSASAKSLEKKAELITLKNALKDFISYLETEQYQSLVDFQPLRTSLMTFLESLDNPSTLLENGKNVIWDSHDAAITASEAVIKKLHSFLTKMLFRRNLSLFLAAVCFCSIMLMYMTQVIRKPLENLRRAAIELGKGNMTVRVPITTKDEIGVISAEFNKMAAFFENILKDAKQISHQLVESVAEVDDHSKQFESNIALQQKIIYHLSVETKAIASTSQNFSKSFKEIARGAGFTSRLAVLGSESLEEMDHIMQQMVGSSNNIVSTLSNLQEHVGKINGVISTIIKIADQSNLLSLNTAIKTNKCRLKGSGFAIVAEKIKELADQTAFGTLDIEQAVQKIVSVVMEAVQEVEDFSMQISSQVESDSIFSENLKRVMDLTKDQITKFEMVNMWMEGQSEEAKKIHYSILLLAEALQQSVHSVKRLFQELQLLYHSAQSLKQATDKFHCGA